MPRSPSISNLLSPDKRKMVVDLSLLLGARRNKGKKTMNIWNEDLMCFWLKIEPKNETTIGIYLSEGSCTDMSGAIKTAKNLMPKVVCHCPISK